MFDMAFSYLCLWSMDIVKRSKLQIYAAEIWFYWRLLRIRWTDKRTNESVFEEPSLKPELLSTINRRKFKYSGHANRNTKINRMTTVLQGKVEVRRNRGRSPISYMTNITQSSGLSQSEVVHMSRDQQQWHPTVLGQRSSISVTPTGDIWLLANNMQAKKFRVVLIDNRYGKKKMVKKSFRRPKETCMKEKMTTNNL